MSVSCLQVASPWDRAIAHARFGVPEPESDPTDIEIEAAWVVARSRGSGCASVVGSGRRCAQDGRERVSKHVASDGVHGGDDDDDLCLLDGDESDDVRGRVIGGVCGLLELTKCVECPSERSFTPPFPCISCRA